MATKDIPLPGNGLCVSTGVLFGEISFRISVRECVFFLRNPFLGGGAQREAKGKPTALSGSLHSFGGPVLRRPAAPRQGASFQRIPLEHDHLLRGHGRIFVGDRICRRTGGRKRNQ